MADAAGRLSAALADRYRIERELGAGGMATVYLAHDVRHDRKVALKVLRPELAAVLGAERFVVEIRTTAALQHPHILPLFDSGTADTFLYYVMPYIEGETLRDRLNRESQLGVDEAVKLTTEIADALDYAHRHGVIHRDIKPENILLHDGRPMVADFGIALALSAAAGGRMTETGMSLGTPHYMSPEQATAEKEITGRSDVYSLASVLYEMLAGQPPHIGGTAQQIIMKIIAEPVADVTSLRRSVPPHVAAALGKALEKLPADRFASAKEFAEALANPAYGGTVGMATGVRPGAPRTPWRRIAIAASVTAVGFAALATWALVRGTPPAAHRAPVEFAFRMGAGPGDQSKIAMSADGRRIIQAVRDSSGVPHLVVRDLASTSLVTVPGTAYASNPAFSPDGAWIAFVQGGALRKMPAAGGPSTVLAESVVAGPAWGADGALLFTRSNDGLWRVAASGGTPERLTTIDTARREWSHWWPQVLPGGRAALFNNFSTPIARSRIEAIELASGRRVVLVEGAVFARYAPSGHLLYMRDGAIFAVPFDARRLRVLGPEVPVLTDVAWAVTDGVAGFDVAANGTLVYLRASDWNTPARVAWLDRAGRETPAVPDIGHWAEPRLSPDGRWIALTRLDPSWQIWIYDVGRRVLTQLTRTQGVSFNALWMPDSRSIIHTMETPVYDLGRVRIDGSAADTLMASPYDKYASSVSADGRRVAYSESRTRDRLMLATFGPGAGAPTHVDPGDASQRAGVFSPDGRWLAYEETGPSGQDEVYILALGERGGRRQVSNGGGSQPRWTRGGRELVYRDGDAVMAVAFQPATGEAGTPARLFRRVDAGRIRDPVGYDVTPDGSRFLMVLPVERPDAQPVVVVLNWVETLKERIP